MIASHSALSRRQKRLVLCSLASSAILSAGCANLTGTAPASAVASSAAKLSGSVHGGNQPVAFATVNLYFAGQTGIGSAATLVATTKSADDGAGNFSFTKLADGQANSGTTNSFSCPTTGGDPFVYVVARGGNTMNTHDSSVNNSASVFIAPMGRCALITTSTFVDMSEAVTAATVAAVHQYMNVVTGDIGADGVFTSYAGLQNSFTTVSTLVDLSTGRARASSPLVGNAAGITVTATPEQAKLNQVANILASCINNATASATPCTTLFNNAVPPASGATTSGSSPSFPTPTDVLQAAYYMFANPTDTTTANRTNLYNLSTAAGAPFQPTLTAVPTDWSVAVQYSSTSTCGTGGNFFSSPFDINVDLSGTIWVSNATSGSGTLVGMTPFGGPNACVSLNGASRGGTVDSVGNIWSGDSEHNVAYRWDNVANTKLAFPTAAPVLGMAADGAGNVFFSTVTSPSVYIIPNAASATAAVTPVQISTVVGSAPTRLIVDDKGSIWVSGGGSSIAQITPGSSGGSNFLNGYVTNTYSTPSPNSSLTVGKTQTVGASTQNSVYVAAGDPTNQLTALTGSGATYAVGTGFPTASGAAGLHGATSVALDGAQSVWATNFLLDSYTGMGNLSAIASTGASLSPDNGPSTAGGFQKASSYLSAGRVITIDQSGNVWIGRDGANSITEVVGAAVPIYQPYAIALKAGRFQTIP